MTTAPAHAILPPSSAARWAGQCEGSALVEARNPETERSEEALAGDAAHHIGTTMLADLKAHGQARVFKAGTVLPNGVVATDEMIEAADLFVDDVVDSCGPESLAALHIEETVEAFNTVSPHNFGRPDVWWAAIGATGAYLYVDDFKYGHRFVDAFENWQLIDYTAAILERPEFAGIPHDRIQIELKVCQPRNYHELGPIRRWTVTAAELAPFFARLKSQAALAMGTDAATRVGSECWDCKGRHQCEALMRAADTAMDIAGNTIPMDLPPAALGTSLRMLERALELLEARVTGLRGVAEGHLRANPPRAVPGYELTRGTAREIWTADAGKIFALGDVLGVQLRKEPLPITPNQARKAGVPDNLVAGYATRPAGALKLGQTSTTLARKVFSK